MLKYLDKDFFKFFWGFVAIIILSLILIVAGKMYQNRENTETVNIGDSTQPDEY